jgi:hypothetical protein
MRRIGGRKVGKLVVGGKGGEHRRDTETKRESREREEKRRGEGKGSFDAIAISP